MVKVFIHTEEKDVNDRYISLSNQNIIIQKLFKHFQAIDCGYGVWKIGQDNLNLLITKLNELNVEIIHDENTGLSNINEQIMVTNFDDDIHVKTEIEPFYKKSLEYLQDNDLFKIRLPVNKYMFACFYKLKKKQILKDEWVLTEPQFREFQKVCFEKNFKMNKSKI